MLVRSALLNYSRLLGGISLAFLAIALAGCNDKAAETAPSRPVLVATAHYEAETPERSFVGTIRPRIEADMGFRVAGKVARRVVEVGQTVEVGQPLATLDEADLKLQAEQAEAEYHAATGVLAQAGAAETRAKELRGKGWTTDAQMEQARAAADEARARLSRAARSVELTRNSLSYATLSLTRAASSPRPWSSRVRSSLQVRPQSAWHAFPKRRRWSPSPRCWWSAPKPDPPR